MDILPIVEPAVFIDRDNTIIANDGDLGDPEAVRLLDGVADGLLALCEAGFRLIIVTNQGGVARGKFTENDVDSVHQKIASVIDETTGVSDVIDRFYYCPYHPKARIKEYRREHPWRKPNPGMLLQAASDMKLDLSSCWMVGDQARDVSAGEAAGCLTALVTQNTELREEAKATVAVETFAEAVDAILAQAPDFASLAELQNQNGEATELGEDPSSTVMHRGSEPRKTAAGSNSLKRAINELTEELRTDRQKRAEFTGLRLGAALCQLLALLLALLGLLQVGSTDAFIKWMIGAALVEMLTISVLLWDLRG